ncbi:MAG: C40 family peptidase [Proteobacteria bacterium]|nr:C40 family peptidase [Pseudomonadota bacterium]
MAKTQYRITVPVGDMFDKPNGGLVRQILFGEGFLCDLTTARDGWIFGTRAEDGYTGYIRQENLSAWVVPNAQVGLGGAHVYSVAEVKTLPVALLPFQAKICVSDDKNDSEFAELATGGFIPHSQILNTQKNPAKTDYVSIAEMFLNTPYLWGGESQFGMDCSGLIYRALRGVGMECPADSTPQQGLGQEIPTDNTLTQNLIRGDLIFWHGHVGMMRDSQTLLHANAHHMRTVAEPLAQVITRIKADTNGAIIARRRLAKD